MSFRGFSAGLLTAQAIASVHVRLTGIAHFRKARAILDAGYIPVPGSAAVDSLDGWGAAFCGGLFFTLTVGMSLTLLALPAVGLWRRGRARAVPVRCSIAAFWLAFLALLNANGFSAAATAYGVLVPTAVLAVSARLPERRIGISRSVAAIHLIGLVLLGGIGVRSVDGAFFSGIRDHLLLSNTAGIGINHFYYRYTLLAAQAFKSLDQELLRTCRISAFPEDPAAGGRLARRLARLDWLAVGEGHPADMVIEGGRGTLSLSHRGREILTVPAEDFLARPRALLAEFSAEADRMGGLRWLAYVSLTGVCLMAVYGSLYFPVRRVFGRMLGPTGAAAAAAAVAVAAGGALVCFPPWTRQAPGAGVCGGKRPPVAPRSRRSRPSDSRAGLDGPKSPRDRGARGPRIPGPQPGPPGAAVAGQGPGGQPPPRHLSGPRGAPGGSPDQCGLSGLPCHGREGGPPRRRAASVPDRTIRGVVCPALRLPGGEEAGMAPGPVGLRPLIACIAAAAVIELAMARMIDAGRIGPMAALGWGRTAEAAAFMVVMSRWGGGLGRIGLLPEAILPGLVRGGSGRLASAFLPPRDLPSCIS